MPPRKRTATQPQAAVASTAGDQGVPTENVVRDPDEVPQSDEQTVSPELDVENVIVDATTDDRNVSTNNDDGGSGDTTPPEDDHGST